MYEIEILLQISCTKHIYCIIYRLMLLYIPTKDGGYLHESADISVCLINLMEGRQFSFSPHNNLPWMRYTSLRQTTRAWNKEQCGYRRNTLKSSSGETTRALSTELQLTKQSHDKTIIYLRDCAEQLLLKTKTTVQRKYY